MHANVSSLSLSTVTFIHFEMITGQFVLTFGERMCWGKKWSLALRLQHSDMRERKKKSFWAVWELQLTFQRFQINIFCTVMITRTSNSSQGISCFYCAFTFCFKTIHNLKAEHHTFQHAHVHNVFSLSWYYYYIQYLYVIYFDTLHMDVLLPFTKNSMSSILL